MFYFPAVGTDWTMPTAGWAGLAPGSSAKMHKMTPIRTRVLSWERNPRILFAFPHSVMLGAGPEHGPRARKEGAGTVRGSQVGCGAFSAPVLPRSTGQAGHCTKDNVAIIICKQAGVFSSWEWGRACMSIKYGPGHLASRNELLFFPRSPLGVGVGKEEKEPKNTSYLTHFA